MIYQLKYPNKEIAIQDLLQKGIYNEDLQFGNNVQAIVEIGLIVDAYINEVAVYFDGYHYDIMTDEVIEFDFIVVPKNPRHKFL